MLRGLQRHSFLIPMSSHGREQCEPTRSSDDASGVGAGWQGTAADEEGIHLGTHECH
jgi:hypothetical protein